MMLRLFVVIVALFGSQTIALGQIDAYCVATNKVGSKADDVIRVTPDGVAFPPGAKYKIPDNYVQNPHRSGSYGEVVDGKFRERLRIDPATPPGKKGPEYGHYHLDGGKEHFSPRPGDRDPGF